MPRRSTVHAVLAGALGLLSACTSSVEAGYDPARHPGSGVALVSVTQTRGPWLARASAIFFQFDRDGPGQSRIVTTGPWNLEDDAEQSVGHLYALEMPVGTHRLSTWWLTNGIGQEVTPAVPPPPLTFDIVPDTVTYLGNLHAILRFDSSLLGIALVNGAVPVIQDRAARDIPLAERTYPRFVGHIAANPLPQGQWGGDTVSRTTDPSVFVPPPFPRR